MKPQQKILMSVMLFILMLSVTGTAMAAPVAAANASFSGSYQTALKSGTLKFTFAARTCAFGYCSGVWTVDGVRYNGYYKFVRLAGNYEMRWFYDKAQTLTAGSITATVDPATMVYSGPITFYDRTGAVTDTGTALLK